MTVKLFDFCCKLNKLIIVVLNFDLLQKRKKKEPIESKKMNQLIETKKNQSKQEEDDKEKRKQLNEKYRYSRFALASLFFLIATSISWIIAMAFTDFVEKSFSSLRNEKQKNVLRGVYALITLIGGFIILYGMSLIVFNDKPWALKPPQLFEGFF